MNASIPKLAVEFSRVLAAFNANGEISQLAFFWLCCAQMLSSPHSVVVGDAIKNNDLETGWKALKKAGPSVCQQMRKAGGWYYLSLISGPRLQRQPSGV